MREEISDRLDAALRAAEARLSPESHHELDLGSADVEARGIIRAALLALGTEFVLEIALDAAIERLGELVPEAENHVRGSIHDSPTSPNYRRDRR